MMMKEVGEMLNWNSDRFRVGILYRDGKVHVHRATNPDGELKATPDFSVDIREIIALTGAFLIAGIFAVKAQDDKALLLASNALSYAFGRVITSRKG